MIEDVISDIIDLSYKSSNHIIASRIPRFLNDYAEEGISEWRQQSSSYSTKYGIGAYLLRNYGGAELLNKIATNNLSGIESITAALEGDLTFNDVLIKYGEAMIYSGHVPKGLNTYDKAVTSTVNDKTYTSYEFDVWNIARQGTLRGPRIYDLNQRALRPHSFSIHSADIWRNKFGSYSITLRRPVNANTVLILMVK